MVGYDSDAYDTDIIEYPLWSEMLDGHCTSSSDDYDETASDWVTYDVEDKKIPFYSDTLFISPEKSITFYRCRYGEHWHYTAKGVT